MNTKEPMAVLQTVEGGRVALQGVAMRAVLQGMLAEVDVEQTYRNLEETHIEAVYTFPLPLDAVLLELEVAIGERRLAGVVVEKRQAENGYEDAVSEGNRAILLQQSGEGLYTMNVGNLLPREAAVIRFRYALLNHWTGNALRFMLPTALAPRYGDPLGAGLEPHQIPPASLAAEYAFDLQVSVRGILARARIESPSHRIALEEGGGNAVIRLAGTAWLDRDFVLNITADASAAAMALVRKDGAGHVAMASFRPAIPGEDDPTPRSIKLVVDCSGSMSGDSIVQAKEALLHMLDRLRDKDQFNLVAFGSDYKILFASQVAATRENKLIARSFVHLLNADMGGTEMARALKAAFLIPSDLAEQDVLLITDGEIWDHEPLIRHALDRRHRLFTVGVGSAAAENVLRNCAEKTGGACELVSPRENMADRIVRHFQRIYQRRADDVLVEWPGNPAWVCPAKPNRVFAGDTVHVFAAFPERPEGEAILRIRLEGGGEISQPVSIDGTDAPADGELLSNALPRLAAAHRLKEEDSPEPATRLALDYQLISRHTSYLVVEELPEGERARNLPGLRVAPQMLAAGWGGTGSVVHCVQEAAGPTVIRRGRASYSTGDTLTIPAFLRKHAGSDYSSDSSQPSMLSPQQLVLALNSRFHTWFRPARPITDLPELAALKSGRARWLPKAVVDTLQALVDAGWDEAAVIAAFLHALLHTRPGEELSESAAKAIVDMHKGIHPASALERLMGLCLASASASEWNWCQPLSLPQPGSLASSVPQAD